MNNREHIDDLLGLIEDAHAKVIDLSLDDYRARHWRELAEWLYGVGFDHVPVDGIIRTGYVAMDVKVPDHLLDALLQLDHNEEFKPQ